MQQNGSSYNSMSSDSSTIPTAVQSIQTAAFGSGVINHQNLNHMIPQSPSRTTMTTQVESDSSYQSNLQIDVTNHSQSDSIVGSSEDSNSQINHQNLNSNQITMTHQQALEYAQRYRVQEIKKMATDEYLDTAELENLVEIVNSLATAKYPDHLLFTKISKKLQNDLYRASWEQLATISWAFAQNAEYDKDLFTRLADIMLRKMDSSTPQLLIKCVSSFIKLNFRDDRVLYMMGKRMRKFLTQEMMMLTELGVIDQDELNSYIGGDGKTVINVMNRNLSPQASSSVSNSASDSTDHSSSMSLLNQQNQKYYSARVSFSCLTSLIEICARTAWMDAACFRRVIKYINCTTHRLRIADRMTIARFFHYLQWQGVWNTKLQQYLKQQFLYSECFDDEQALLEVPQNSGLVLDRDIDLIYESNSISIHDNTRLRNSWKRRREIAMQKKRRESELSSLSEESSQVDQLQSLQQDTDSEEIRLRNFSPDVLARMSNATYSIYGHADVRLLDQLLSLYNRGLSRVEKSALVSGNSNLSNVSNNGITEYATQRFLAALVSTRFSYEEKLKLDSESSESNSDFNSNNYDSESCPAETLLNSGLTLSTVRDLLPDICEIGAEHTQIAPLKPCPFAVWVRADATTRTKQFNDTTNANGSSSDSESNSNSVSNLNATSSVLHEEVSTTVQKIWKTNKGKLSESQPESDEVQYGKPEFEAWCGLWYVDTLLRPTSPMEYSRYQDPTKSDSNVNTVPSNTNLQNDSTNTEKAPSKLKLKPSKEQDDVVNTSKTSTPKLKSKSTKLKKESEAAITTPLTDSSSTKSNIAASKVKTESAIDEKKKKSSTKMAFVNRYIKGKKKG